MVGRIAVLLLALSVVGLSGCAPTPTVHSSVSQLSEVSAEDLAGSTLFMAPMDKQVGFLEFRRYAGLIADEIEKRGAVVVEDLDGAQYLLMFDYGVGGPRTEVYSAPIWGQIGGGTTTHSGTVRGSGGLSTYSGTSYQTPQFGVVGSTARSRTAYTRYFVLSIYDVEAYRDRNEILAVYEAQVSSSGSSGTFQEVGVCMIQSLFERFPGNGSYRRELAMTRCDASPQQEGQRQGPMSLIWGTNKKKIDP